MAQYVMKVCLLLDVQNDDEADDVVYNLLQDMRRVEHPDSKLIDWAYEETDDRRNTVSAVPVLPVIDVRQAHSLGEIERLMLDAYDRGRALRALED